MTLRATQLRFLYSGAASSASAQSDPLLSLGGLRPDDVTPANSEPYRVATLDAASPSLIQVVDTETDTPASSDPAIGDWLTVLNGPAARSYGRVTAVDYVGHVITIDRALSALSANGNQIRTSRRQNLFPDATVGQVQSGLIDHRMLFLLKTDTGSENNIRFWVDPIQPNGCDIDLAASTVAMPDGGTVNSGSTIAVGTESPFDEFGNVAENGTNWVGTNGPRVVFSEGAAVPVAGSGTALDQSAIPIWIRRRIPANAAPGQCVFLINYFVPDAIAQDATADPNPFRAGFLFAWNNPEPTYSMRVFSDRLLHTGGTVRIVGEVTYADGSPAVGLNARLSLLSGGGSLAVDLDARTDDLGRVQALYTAPASVGSDPTFRLSVPTSSEV
jgi:hypothetical protein